MTPEMRKILDRPCQLCGQPMGKHKASPYGEKREEVGAMGLYCPEDARLPANSTEGRG